MSPTVFDLMAPLCQQSRCNIMFPFWDSSFSQQRMTDNIKRYHFCHVGLAFLFQQEERNYFGDETNSHWIFAYQSHFWNRRSLVSKFQNFGDKFRALIHPKNVALGFRPWYSAHFHFLKRGALKQHFQALEHFGASKGVFFAIIFLMLLFPEKIQSCFSIMIQIIASKPQLSNLKLEIGLVLLTPERNDSPKGLLASVCLYKRNNLSTSFLNGKSLSATEICCDSERMILNMLDQYT